MSRELTYGGATIVNRQSAWELLNQYTKNPSLINHALAVEAAMRSLAKAYGEDEEKWGIVGLLHDFDYERYPELPDHPLKGSEILKELGYPDDVRHAIVSHALPEVAPRNSLLDKALYAVDELCGFIIAVALVRPSKKLADVTVQSVKKKLRDKRFAAGVNRADVIGGAEALGLELDKHIENTLRALQGQADQLGL